MFSLDLRLLEVACLTVIIEVPIFYCFGYKRWQQLLAFALANIASNLLLNEALPPYSPTPGYWMTLIAGELLVVALEFALMLYIVLEQRQKLFQTIVITNLVSIIVGIILLF